MNWIKRILRAINKSSDKKETHIRYESVIIKQGNGEWFHPSSKHPLDHNWRIYGNRAECTDCHQIIERRIVIETPTT